MPDRRDLVRNVWPDKLLYASIMLVVTGLIGALYAGIVLAFGIKTSPNLPAIFRVYPAWLTLALSLASVALAWLAVKQVRAVFGLAGAICGIASLGLFGVGSAFAAIAGAFLALSRIEKEEEAVRAANVGPESWPDKSLAASLFLAVGAGISIAWAVAVLLRKLEFMGATGRAFAVVQLVLGLVALAGAVLLYRQRGMWVGVAGSAALVVSLGAYVLSPLLGIAALVAVRMAEREGEFELQEPAEPGGVLVGAR